MKCPYNRLSETSIQHWKQRFDDNNSPIDGTTVTHYTFKLMDCNKEECGAFYNGKCCYNAGN